MKNILGLGQIASGVRVLPAETSPKCKIADHPGKVAFRSHLADLTNANRSAKRFSFIRKCLSYLFAYGFERRGEGAKYGACDGNDTRYWPPGIDSFLRESRVSDMFD